MHAWLEHHFRVTEACEANIGDVTVQELVSLRQEQHFSAPEALLPPTVMTSCCLGARKSITAVVSPVSYSTTKKQSFSVKSRAISLSVEAVKEYLGQCGAS